MLTTDAGEAPVLAAVASAVNARRAALQAVGAGGRSESAGVITRTAATARLVLSETSTVDLFREFAILDEGAANIRFTPAVFELNRPALAVGAPRPLHRRRGAWPTTASSRATSLSTRPRSSCCSRPSSCSWASGSRRGSTRTRGWPRRSPPARTRRTRCGSAGPPACSSSRRSASTRRAPRRPPSPSINGEEPAGGEDLTDEVASIEPAGEAPVFDLTEEVTQHFVASGVVVHNCSEYMFLDDTACNLASINLVKFLREDGSFDVDGFRHACRLWTTVLEISVLMAAYPSPAIAQRSWDFRTLGLGYANMGTVLMRKGIPYDSPEATAICGAITAIMRGEAYATSAEMARDLGPFPGYRSATGTRMLRVMRNHRRAAYRRPPRSTRASASRPHGIDPAHCPAPLLQAARETWDRAVTLGRAARLPQRPGDGAGPDRHHRPGHGLRHHRHRARLRAGEVQEAGRRRLLQDHQPEPAGGARDGSATPRARSRTSWPTASAARPCAARRSSTTTRSGPRASTTRGCSGSRPAIETAFDISFAFNAWTLGEGYIAAHLGLNEAQLAEWNGNLLRALGFTAAEIEAANDYCCGTMTVEGAPAPPGGAPARSSTAPTAAASGACGSSPPRPTSG